MVEKIKKAVVPVAGLGTRMLPATRPFPKSYYQYTTDRFIEHVVAEAISAGISRIIFITRSGKEAIENHFDVHYELEHRLDKKGKELTLKSVKDMIPKDVNIASVRQNDALGLGHAVLCAKHLLNNEPFSILLPDVLILDRLEHMKNYSFAKLVQAWDQTGLGQIMVERVDPALVENYGIADLNQALIAPFKSVAVNGFGGETYALQLAI